MTCGKARGSTLMPISSSMLLSLLDEVGRRRALADHETDLVEAIVRGEVDSVGLRNPNAGTPQPEAAGLTNPVS